MATSRPIVSRRTEQACREVGQTDVARPVAWLLVVLVGVAVAGPSLTQTVLDLAAGKGPFPALAPLTRTEPGLGGVVEDPFAVNRAFLDAIETSEDRLEDESWLRARLLPPTQRFFTEGLGLGNEQAVAGKDGWWYLADDLGHVVGRGFLAPEVLLRRERDGGMEPMLLAMATGYDYRKYQKVKAVERKGK